MKAERQVVAPGVEYAYYYRKAGERAHGVLIIDQIGYGDSSNTEGFNYTMKEQAEMLLRARTGVNKREHNNRLT